MALVLRFALARLRRFPALDYLTAGDALVPVLLREHVGMAVHEAEKWQERPMEEGLVFAVDPEFVVPEMKLYVRCEDTVVVTKDGCENLTGDAPVEIEQIETVMDAILAALTANGVNPPTSTAAY